MPLSPGLYLSPMDPCSDHQKRSIDKAFLWQAEDPGLVSGFMRHIKKSYQLKKILELYYKFKKQNCRMTHILSESGLFLCMKFCAWATWSHIYVYRLMCMRLDSTLHAQRSSLGDWIGNRRRGGHFIFHTHLWDLTYFKWDYLPLLLLTVICRVPRSSQFLDHFLDLLFPFASTTENNILFKV